MLGPEPASPGSPRTASAPRLDDTAGSRAVGAWCLEAEGSPEFRRAAGALRDGFGERLPFLEKSVPFFDMRCRQAPLKAPLPIPTYVPAEQIGAEDVP